MGRTKKEKKIIDFATKKTVHVSLSVASHAGLRIECFKHKISMQEALEEFSHLVSIGNQGMLRVLESVRERKIQKEIRRLEDTDADTIYSILEMESPLKDDT
jgi:hypothetical protein